MSEKYSIHGSYSWFQKYLFSSKNENITALAKSVDYDSSNMEVKLTINGLEIRVDDFNELLDKWSDMVEEGVKKQFDYLNTELAVKIKAEELIRSKLGKINEVLYEIENSLWKLEVED